MGYVDLHSHILSGLDDGPATPTESLELVTELVRMGFDTLCVTPHQRLGLHTPDLGAVRATARELQQAVDSSGMECRLVPGAENCWDDLLWERSRLGQIPCYDSTSVFLFDLAGWVVPSELDQQLFSWRISGLLPVLAHVERYESTANLEDRLYDLSQQAVLTVNLDALGGGMGRPAAKLARKLVSNGIIHALTTDLHGRDALGATASGIKWAKRRLGPETTTLLLEENPRTVLAGHLPELAVD